ncbi:MAG: hypothetical protein JJU22_11455, partial [Gammaproteobacteria bacterium]|nr:hypothetical protein [Gammaproteobacteria bacterium]
MGERYFAQRNAPISTTFSEGIEVSFARPPSDRPNRCAIRAFPQWGHSRSRATSPVGERYFAQRNAPISKTFSEGIEVSFGRA